MHAIFTTALLTGVFGLLMGSSQRQPATLVGIKMTPAAAAAAAAAPAAAPAAPEEAEALPPDEPYEPEPPPDESPPE